ncbi:reverse transcriptase family protein [uncultured Thiodictyon sp.]|jgi:hypothetical protein|uniref:reverse transcriptase family protein n=1 Tax=uncultured Thiodictyon sp. TaxID=1846217 RepID=UPI0025EFD239|nr:reverse transcriptase family protein [uncultured Thiodictyon sp.]
MGSGYKLDQSRLFKLASKRKLAGLLGVSIKQMMSSATAPDCYRLWPTKPKYPSKLPILSHKPREIQEPVGLLKKIQERLQDLLARIETPAYLLSAKKGCSYVRNASLHTAPGQLIRIDIKGFYRNASDRFVFRFFQDDLQCSPDIAKVLTNIVCWNGSLPTGSSVSPIMSFFAYRPMFDELNGLASSIDAVMTVYVDDIVFSGQNVTGSLIPKAKIIIRKSGLRGHKISAFKKGATRVVTGTAVTQNGQLDIPNRRHRKIRALRHEYDCAINAADKRIYYNALIGQYREGSRLDPDFRRKATDLQAEMGST